MIARRRRRSAPRTRSRTRAGAVKTTSLAPVTEEPTGEANVPTQCSACRGSGVVTSNLGGETHQLPCPWCEGGGVVLADHDAQAHWRAEQRV